MDVHLFKNKVCRCLGELCDVKGDILCTSWRGITEGLPFYIMGINPGGGTMTIRESINLFPESIGIDQVKGPLDGNTNNPWWSGYLDDHWRDQGGFNPIQKHLFEFASALSPKIDLRKVCGTNLVFAASAKPSDLHNWHEYAERCWPVHKLLLGIVKPHVILTFGKEPYDFVYSKSNLPHDVSSWPEKRIPRQRGCRAFRGIVEGREVTVIGVPHLGRFSLSGKSDLMVWIQSLLMASVSSMPEAWWSVD